VNTITHFTGTTLQPLFNNWIQCNNSTFQRQLRYWQPNLRTLSSQRLSKRNVLYYIMLHYIILYIIIFNCIWSNWTRDYCSAFPCYFPTKSLYAFLVSPILCQDYIFLVTEGTCERRSTGQLRKAPAGWVSSRCYGAVTELLRLAGCPARNTSVSNRMCVGGRWHQGSDQGHH
jgi:hypothetical protein